MEVLARLQPAPALEDRQQRRPASCPGYVVDSSTTRCPCRRRCAISASRRARSRGRARAASRAASAARSGSRPRRGARRSRSWRARPVVDEPLQRLRGDVLDVALAAVQPRHHARRRRPRAGRELPASANTCASGTPTYPAPIIGDVPVLIARRDLARRGCGDPSRRRDRRRTAPGGRRGSRAAATAVPSFGGFVVDEGVGAELDGVDPLRAPAAAVTHGTPYQYASFCRPPESVTITRACDASAANGEVAERLHELDRAGERPLDASTAARVRGWAGKTTRSSRASGPSRIRRERAPPTFASRWIVATMYRPGVGSASGATLPRDRSEAHRRVGHHVADDLHHALDALGGERRAGSLVRCEEQRREAVDLDAVALLGHREVAAPEPRLHVGDRHAASTPARAPPRSSSCRR